MNNERLKLSDFSTAENNQHSPQHRCLAQFSDCVHLKKHTHRIRFDPKETSKVSMQFRLTKSRRQSQAF